MESLLKFMMDFLVDLGVDPDRALMVSGFGLIVIGFIAVVLLSQLSLLPEQVKNKKEMQHMTGRAVGTILNGTLYTETYDYGHQTGQTAETTTKHRYIVTYEFTVNGVTYQGQGEGSYAFWEKKGRRSAMIPEIRKTIARFFSMIVKRIRMFLRRYFQRRFGLSSSLQLPSSIFFRDRDIVWRDIDHGFLFCYTLRNLFW